MPDYDIDNLISRYVDDASRIVKCMAAAWKTSALLAAWHSGEKPASGCVALPDGRVLEYRFHGRGCYFKLGQLRIDVELCRDSEAIGFDSWRLLRYAEETLNQTGIELEDIELELKRKVAEGTLLYSSESPYFGLYHLPAKAAEAAIRPDS
jgi:hypothetical protein